MIASSKKQPLEQIPLTIDFSEFLAEEETLEQDSYITINLDDTNTTPDMLDSQIVESKKITGMVKGGVADNFYVISFFGKTSTGSIHQENIILEITNISSALEVVKAQSFINYLRNFLGDTPELNALEGVKESSDEELKMALDLALDELNNTFTPVSNYKEFKNVPKIILMKLAVLKVLTMKGILTSRNTLTWNDAGGITVQDYDKYGRYINYFNILIADAKQSVQSWKTARNIESAYGGVHSDYRF